MTTSDRSWLRLQQPVVRPAYRKRDHDAFRNVPHPSFALDKDLGDLGVDARFVLFVLAHGGGDPSGENVFVAWEPYAAMQRLTGLDRDRLDAAYRALVGAGMMTVLDSPTDSPAFLLHPLRMPAMAEILVAQSQVWEYHDFAARRAAARQPALI